MSTIYSAICLPGTGWHGMTLNLKRETVDALLGRKLCDRHIGDVMTAATMRGALYTQRPAPNVPRCVEKGPRMLELALTLAPENTEEVAT
jgi:hypothetical protein